MKVELIKFKTEDNIVLDGYVTDVNSKTIVIAVNGMSSNFFKGREKILSENYLENQINYFGFNNRGSELVKYILREENGVKTKSLGGTSYEDPIDGYYDVKAAIEKAVELGFEKIYLQGHSLGCTKTLYTYNRLKKENSELLKYIKGIILISLIDIPRVLKIFLNDKYEKMLKYAEDKEKENKIYEIMPKESFIHPVSVKTFLRYIRDNKEFDFARYWQNDFKFDELNNIDVPIFMRWGNKNEMIEQDAKDLADMMNEKIFNNQKDIDFIDGANHGYAGKEKVLASQLITFIKNNN